MHKSNKLLKVPASPTYFSITVNSKGKKSVPFFDYRINDELERADLQQN